MNSSSDSRYIKQSRKFHDAWAFILYAISYTGFTSYSIINIKETKMDLMFNSATIQNGVVCSSIVGAFILINFLGLRFIPELFLKITISCFPLILICTAIFAFTIGTLISVALGLLFWGIFIYKYWSMLKLVGKILQTSVSILMSNLFTTLLGIIVCTTLLCVQLCLMLAINLDEILDAEKGWGSKIFAFFYVLNFFWTITNIIYFFKVYVTSIIAYNVVEQAESSGSKFGAIMKNSLYALGSVCFAGLLVAIVSTLRFFINNERDRRRREEESNALVDILLCLANFFLAILERFIEFANALTLPYIAVHGEGYVESIEKAFEVSLRQSPLAIIGLAALDYALMISTILTTSLCGISLFYFIGDSPGFILLKSMAVTTLIPLLLYFNTMMTISSSYLGLIYMEAEDSSAVQHKYIEEVRDPINQYK